uniref:MP n=1 Tax=Rhododendron betaflexivirus 1 TaxID=2794406 RepID=A0A7T5UFT4_9VIRU|nr:MP [Rhododendron betaflexivirus 1]
MNTFEIIKRALFESSIFIGKHWFIAESFLSKASVVSNLIGIGNFLKHIESSPAFCSFRGPYLFLDNICCSAFCLANEGFCESSHEVIERRARIWSFCARFELKVTTVFHVCNYILTGEGIVSLSAKDENSYFVGVKNLSARIHSPEFQIGVVSAILSCDQELFNHALRIYGVEKVAGAGSFGQHNINLINGRDFSVYNFEPGYESNVDRVVDGVRSNIKRCAVIRPNPEGSLELVRADVESCAMSFAATGQLPSQTINFLLR